MYPTKVRDTFIISIYYVFICKPGKSQHAGVLLVK